MRGLEKVWRNDTLVSTYSYDPNGNRIAHWTPTEIDSGTYDAQDRMVSYAGAQYIYGLNGDLQTKIGGTDTTNYTYDAFGNLTQVVMPDGDVIQYVIDGQNRRIARIVNGRITNKWLYAGQLTPVAELDSADNVVARFSSGYLNKGETIYQIIRDRLGSVRLVVNVSTGTIAQRIDYDEFGNILYDSNPGFQPLGYANGLYDPETKLVRFGTRDYDCTIGRWTRKDPIGFEGKTSNLYEYCFNEPINTYDPDGLQVMYFSHDAQRMYWVDAPTGIVLNSWAAHDAVAKGCNEQGRPYERLPNGDYTASAMTPGVEYGRPYGTFKIQTGEIRVQGLFMVEVLIYPILKHHSKAGKVPSDV